MDRDWRRLRIVALAGDTVAVVVAYTVAAGILFGADILQPGGQLWPAYPVLSWGVALFTVTVGWQFRIYRRGALLGGHYIYPSLMTVATYGVVAVIVLSYLVRGPSVVSRAWLVSGWMGSIIGLSFFRFVLRQVALSWRARGRLVRNVLIAGANQQGIAVAEQLNDPLRHGTRVLGFLDDYQRPGTEVAPGLRVVGHPASVLEEAKNRDASEVVIIPGALAWDSYRLLAEIVTRPDAPIVARISPTFYDLLTTSAELSHIAYVPMLTLDRTRLSGLNAAMKKIYDRGAAAALLVLVTPALLYWRVRAWYLGVPMLERSRVVGMEGREFVLLGLSRYVSRSPVMARLPALWNVVRQDLSLVGPRPVREVEVDAHRPWLSNLFAMRPGLTGLWRVRGGQLSMEEWVALDLYYIRNYTIALDVQILLITARRLLQRSVGGRDGLARWNEAPGPSPSGPAAVAQQVTASDGSAAVEEAYEPQVGETR
jgi:lipopolysaccharide/colanic/teichoic acid biosynthesis glycosyltransferase